MKQFSAVLSNPAHPEYGAVTIPFPIPDELYSQGMEQLEALEIGDAVRQDCRLNELTNGYPVLERLEMTTVNVDELDYLAKRLDSFDSGEAAQFQAMVHKLDLSDIKDFIQKLNALVGRIDRMDSRQCALFAGALDAESINGLDLLSIVKLA